MSGTSSNTARWIAAALLAGGASAALASPTLSAALFVASLVALIRYPATLASSMRSPLTSPAGRSATPC
mgnify:CR=1 FL=1